MLDAIDIPVVELPPETPTSQDLLSHLADLTPVSYTHLDVYKRQLLRDFSR